VQFLRIILILIIIYYLGKLILRLIFPYFFQRYINKKTGNYFGRSKHSKHKNKREGEITIDYINKKEKKISKDEGEYINFKEVKK
jgi:hypothetical protein